MSAFERLQAALKERDAARRRLELAVQGLADGLRSALSAAQVLELAHEYSLAAQNVVAAVCAAEGTCRLCSGWLDERAGGAQR